ncbi:CbtB domain-containing protein [Candidatus Thiosymbion oneisti]|uniref:CbtB domain-containing protein n=1 Tax=Candidatus Thiosymbion oneisti TaxID=589554 RepID=UPI00159F2709|nr:CbtB domain-containing protein [Candidatus Thiosymbion oneisti]
MSSLTSDMKGRAYAQRRTHLWPALSAALLGLVILYGAGFAPLAAHNAAHDARHTAAFPCH